MVKELAEEAGERLLVEAEEDGEEVGDRVTPWVSAGGGRDGYLPSLRHWEMVPGLKERDIKDRDPQLMTRLGDIHSI